MEISIKSSGVEITGDYYKTILLQDVQDFNFPNCALAGRKVKNKKQFSSNSVKCYGCQEVGHIYLQKVS